MNQVVGLNNTESVIPNFAPGEVITLTNKASFNTLLTLSNALQLGSFIVSETVGNDISDSLGGNALTSDLVQELILLNFRKKMTSPV